MISILNDFYETVSTNMWELNQLKLWGYKDISRDISNMSAELNHRGQQHVLLFGLRLLSDQTTFFVDNRKECKVPGPDMNDHLGTIVYNESLS